MQSPAQSLLPVGQVPPQEFPSQVATPPVGTGQATHDIPQVAMSSFGTHVPVQSWVPGAQMVKAAPSRPPMLGSLTGRSKLASTPGEVSTPPSPVPEPPVPDGSPTAVERARTQPSELSPASAKIKTAERRRSVHPIKRPEPAYMKLHPLSPMECRTQPPLVPSRVWLGP